MRTFFIRAVKLTSTQRFQHVSTPRHPCLERALTSKAVKGNQNSFNEVFGMRFKGRRDSPSVVELITTFCKTWPAVVWATIL